MIPIFRGKKIDSEEWVEGYYKKFYYLGSGEGKDVIVHSYDRLQDEIDPSTLAIHFPDMIDSEGNKIFASLSEDGKGGSDVFFDVNSQHKKDMRGCFIYRLNNFFIYNNMSDKFHYANGASNIKVTGIQE